MQRESPLQTIVTATILCVVCSVIVSASAVGLRSVQEENKQTFQAAEYSRGGGLLAR